MVIIIIYNIIKIYTITHNKEEDKMAWQYPKHVCGHTGERYQAYGKIDGRERQLAAIESMPCPECRRAAADKQSTEAGLPMLVGSDKQIAWAAEIRERALRLIPADRAARVVHETSARWWIDNRNSI